MIDCLARAFFVLSTASLLVACSSGSEPGATAAEDAVLSDVALDASSADASSPPVTPAEPDVVAVDAAPAVVVPTCEEFCAEIGVCGDELAPYANEQDCLVQCRVQAVWDAGGYDDESVNTIGCRLAHLRAVNEGADVKEGCAAAGPTGGGICGSYCESYCQLAMGSCRGGATLFSGRVDCDIACATLAVADDPNAGAGDSVQCRIRQLLLAGNDPSGASAAGYCDAASLEGAPPCGAESGLGCRFAIHVDELPFEAEGDTTEVESSFGLPGTVCGQFGDAGTLAGDHVYRLETTIAGTYRIVLDASFDSLLYVSTSCEDPAGTCVESSDGFGDETIELQSGSGVTWYVFVDGSGSVADRSGRYTLTISPPCVPDCAGKACGFDGCGGTCGQCGATQTCGLDGQCASREQAVGNRCANPAVVDAIPFRAEGDTGFASNDFEFGERTCPGTPSRRGGASNDHVYAFTPEVDGTYTLRLDPRFDSAFSLFTTCGDDSTCIGGLDSIGDETIVARMSPPNTYFIVVDGWSNEANVGGTYVLTISEPCIPQCAEKECGPDSCGADCGTCPTGHLCTAEGSCAPPESVPGNACANPFEIDAIPFSREANTEHATPIFQLWEGMCPDRESPLGRSSNDHIYAFTPSAAGVYTFKVAGSFDLSLYLVTDCESPRATCVSGVERGYGNEKLMASLEADVPVYLIVDGFGPADNDAGEYTLTVEPPCIPDCADKECGEDGCGLVCGTCDEGDRCMEDGKCLAADQIDGNTCANPFVIDGTPFAGGGNTEDGTNVYKTGEKLCPGEDQAVGGGANDHAWRFTPTVSGTYSAHVESGFDIVLYVVEDCTNVNNTCRVLAEDSVGAETATLALTADETVFFIVDGYSNSTNQDGAYTLTMDEPCIPMCEGKDCGPDRCGTSCGTCPVAHRCDPEPGQCIPPANTPGNWCENAFEVGALPFEAEGDTGDAEALLSFGQGDCPGVFTDKGVASKDHVYAFTPDADGTYVIEVEGEFDATLYVVTDCTQVHKSCVGASDSSGAERLELELRADETFFIVVDGFHNTSSVHGRYTLRVEELPVE